MDSFYYSPEVKLLIVNYSSEKEEVVYNHHPYSVKITQIGPRPPFYCNPRYEQYYPVI